MSKFDPKEPYNELPLLPPENSIIDLEIYKKAIKATDALSNLNGLLMSAWNNVEVAMAMLNPLYAPEAEASSKVENIATTTEEILIGNVIDKSLQNPEQKEGYYYAKALTNSAISIVKGGKLDIDLIIKIQSYLELEKNKEKGIRKRAGTQIKNEKSGKVYYTPPVGEMIIKNKLLNLIDYIYSKDDIDPLIKMSIMHYQFEAIHPFYDGNGRTGRIMLPLYLMVAGKIKHPFIFLSGYILKNRTQYYERLRAVTEKGEWREWIHYILDGVIETSEKTSKTVLKINNLKKKADEIISAGLPSKHSELSDHIFSNPIFSRQMLAEDKKLDIHFNTAVKYAEFLVQKGVVQKRKMGREWFYFNTKAINELHKFANWR